MARHVMQGKVGFMYADELWVELPGYPSSWVSLHFLLPATPCYSASPWHPSLLGSCNLWAASGLSHSSLGSGSDDLCNCEPSPSFQRRRMGGGHPAAPSPHPAGGAPTVQGCSVLAWDTSITASPSPTLPLEGVGDRSG